MGRKLDLLILSTCLLLLPTILLLLQDKPSLPSHLLHLLFIQLIIGSIAFSATYLFVPLGATYTLRAGLFGKDLGKKGTPLENLKVPESLGIVSGIVYVICVVCSNFVLSDTFQKQSEYTSALHSVSFILFLGFVDDVLDIPWRFKLFFPVVASLPLLTAYSGGTSILLPTILNLNLNLGENLIDLGAWYLLYMLLLACFCTNAINILAGINGLEVGQASVIASFIVLLNLMELCAEDHLSSSKDAHALSLSLMVPFLCSNLGLLYWNWYPSKVFVGDTYTLFAGMTLAVAGILGHFSKTLLLFFTPQVVNFVYSIPQLFGLVPCPRHRLPRLNASTGLLHGVPSHMNLINLVLLGTGPMSEKSLCVVLLFIQSVCCALTLCVRHYLGYYLF